MPNNVLNGNIRGLSGVRVDLLVQSSQSRIDSSNSDKNGNWQFSRPTPGSYDIQFFGRGTSQDDWLSGVEITAEGQPQNIKLIADRFTAVYNQAGDGLDDTNITLSTVYNTSSAPAYTIVSPSSGAANTAAQSALTDNGDGTASFDTDSYFDSYDTAVTIKASAGSVADQLTLVKLKEGSHSLTAVITNAAHTIPTDNDGSNPTLTGAETEIRLYEGSTRLNVDSSGTPVDGTFKLQAKSNYTLSGIAGSSVTATNTDGTPGTAKVAITGNPTADAGTIGIKLDYIRQDGTTGTLDDIIFSFAKSKEGTAGANAKTINISSDSLIFVKAKDGTLSPSSITINGNTQNTTANGAWSTSAGTLTDIVNTHTAPSCKVTSANFVDGMTVTYTLATADGSIADSVTIKQLDAGTDAVTTIIANEAHVLPASNVGAVSDYTGSGTDIDVYEGATALTYDGAGTTAGKWKVVVGDTANITEGTVDANGNIGDHSNASNTTDTYTITYTITGKTSNGTSFSIDKTQSLSKSKEGTAGDHAVQHYIKPTGTALKNSSGTITLEARKINGTSDSILSSGTIKLYDSSNNALTVANGYATGSDGFTGVLDSGDINGSKIITLKDGVNGTPLDTITVVDITDGDDAIVGAIESNNGLSWNRANDGGSWTPSSTTSTLTVTFYQSGSSIATRTCIITRDSSGDLTAPTPDTVDGITYTRTGNGTPNITIEFEHTSSSIIASETLYAVQGGTKGTGGDRGSRKYSASSTSTAWVDSEALAAIPTGERIDGNPQTMDQVTLWKTDDWTTTKYWDGSAWQAETAKTDGGLIIKDSLSMDDVGDGTTYKKVDGGAVDANGKIIKLYDVSGAQYRAIGTAENSIPTLSTNGEMDINRLPSTTHNTNTTQTDVGLNLVENIALSTAGWSDMGIATSDVSQTDVGLSDVLNQAQTYTFSQATIPTALAAGDQWIDTSDGNKMYRATAAGDNTIGATTWVALPPSKGTVGLGSVTNESKSTMFSSPTFTGTVSGVTKTHVGLGSVTNESKSTMFSSPTFTGTVSGVTKTHVGLGSVTNESKSTMFSSPTFTGTVSGVSKTHVGLGNVTNESKTTMFSSPTFSGTVSGVTKTHVGLSNVDNSKFESNGDFKGQVVDGSGGGVYHPLGGSSTDDLSVKDLTIYGEVNEYNSVIITVDDAWVKLNTGNAEVDSGLIVETTDTDDARLFYDVSANDWVMGENQVYETILGSSNYGSYVDHNSVINTHNLTTDINHDALTNFVADEHVAHSSVSVLAGAGMTGGGTIASNRTLNVIAGTGITVNADSIQTNDSAIIHDNLSGFVADEHIGHTSITLTAGVGLSGGGDISANRTFTVDLNELTTETAIASGDFIAMVDITDSGSGKITFANLEATLNHDSLTGFVANEHIDHTTVSISAGGILSGGGTIASNRTISLAHADVDHDQTTNFLANEHIDWTNATQNLSTSGTLTASGYNSSNWDTAYTYSQVGHLPLSGGTLTSDTPLTLYSSTNGAGVGVKFSDMTSGQAQYGHLKYIHTDTQSYGSGNAFILNGSEPTMTILADGKLMYKEGIYSKPATGTGAGTRKDSNWDSAYTHSQSSHSYLPLIGGTLSGDVTTSGALTFSSSGSPIRFENNGNSAAYTKTVYYANQNNTSGNVYNGIFVERGRLSNSGSAEIRHFTIGDRGGGYQWRVDGSGNVTQSGSLTGTSATFSGTIGTTGKVSIYGGSTTATLGIKAHDNGWDGGIVFTSADGTMTAKFHPENGSTYGMMLDSKLYVAGNVGLGVAPDGTYDLKVNGTSYFGQNATFSGDVSVVGSYLVLGEGAYSTSANYVGMKTSYQSGSSDYMILSGKTDGATYVSAKDGESVHIRGGGNNSNNQIVVNDGSSIAFTTASATFSGSASFVGGTNSGLLYHGTTSGRILADGVNKNFGSESFSSGTSGWRIDGSGDAEFQNIVARGEFHTAVFVKDEIHATGGTNLIANAGTLKADFTSVASPTTFTFDIKDPASGHAAIFAVNDIVRIKTVYGSGSLDNWIKVTVVTDNSTYYTYTGVLQSGTAGTFREGTAVIQYGNTTSGGSMMMTSDLAYSPYLDIFTHTGSPWTTTTTKVRLGYLAGITDSDLGGALTGYGLYSENVYLKGSITLASGTFKTNVSGQRIEIDGTANNLRFINSSGQEVLKIDDSLYSNYPGIRFNQYGTLHFPLGGIINLQSGSNFNTQLTERYFDLRSTNAHHLVYLDNSGVSDAGDVKVLDIVSDNAGGGDVYGLVSTASSNSGSVYGIYATASSTSGTAWAGYFNAGNVKIVNDLQGNTATFSGALSTTDLNVTAGVIDITYDGRTCRITPQYHGGIKFTSQTDSSSIMYIDHQGGSTNSAGGFEFRTGQSSLTTRMKLYRDGGLNINNNLTVGGLLDVNGTGTSNFAGLVKFVKSDNSTNSIAEFYPLNLSQGTRITYRGFETINGQMYLDAKTNANVYINSQGTGGVGIGTSSLLYGRLQVTQTANNDESGIGILDSTAGRSMRLWCDSTTSYINSGNGGSGKLVLNQGSGTVGIGGSATSPFHLKYTGGSYGSDSTSGFINENSSSGRATFRNRTVNNDASEFFYDVNGAIRWDVSVRNSSESYVMKWYPQGSTPSYSSVSAHVMQLTQAGALTLSSSLSATSGTFSSTGSFGSKLTLSNSGWSNHLRIDRSGNGVEFAPDPTITYLKVVGGTTEFNVGMNLEVGGTVLTTVKSAISYEAGSNYYVSKHDAEYSYPDNDSFYKKMKSAVVTKSGSLKVNWAGYIQSGTYYWAWKIMKNNGATTLASGAYTSGLASGETASVHAYRNYDVDVSGVEAGDIIELWMASSTSGGGSVTGNGQNLYAKNFGLLSKSPSLEGYLYYLGDSTFSGNTVFGGGNNSATTALFDLDTSTTSDFMVKCSTERFIRVDGWNSNLYLNEDSGGTTYISGLSVLGSSTFSGAVTWSGGGSTNANTAYTYSQVGHLPLSGGTMDNTTVVTNLNADLLDGYHRAQISRYQSGSDFADGTLVTTNINSGNTNGDSFVIEISGKAYGSSRPHTVVAEGYIYNDTIINTNGSNIGGSNFTYLKVMNISGNLCFWWPRHGYWNSYDVFVRSSSAGTSNYNRVTAIANSADPSSATKKIQINLATSWTSANDASGSGLDADTVDGIQGASFLRSDINDTCSGLITFTQDISVGSQTGTWIRSDQMTDAIGWNVSYGVYIGSDIGGTHYLRGNGTFTTGGSTYNLWHAGNDGSGSGLDADNLDGYTWNSSGKDLRGTEIYADNWFRNYNSGEGLYNQATAMHWYSDANNRFRLYSTSTSSAILFTTNGNTVRGYLYADTASSIGFLNTGGQWGLRYLSNDGNSPNLYFLEDGNETWTGNPGSDTGKIEYHSNRFYIAAGSNSTYVCQFRRSGTDVARVENDGKIYAQGSNLVWHAGNDGSGSGLDADLLDGQHGSYYSPTTHTHSYLPLTGGTLTGALTGTSATFSGNIVTTSTTHPQINIDSSGHTILAIDSASGNYECSVQFKKAGTTKWLVGMDNKYEEQNDFIIKQYGNNNASGAFRIDTSNNAHFGTGASSGGGSSIYLKRPSWCYVQSTHSSSKLVLRASTNGLYLNAGATSWTVSSDERLKDIISPIDNAVSIVNGMRAVVGKYKTDEVGTQRSFLIAQDAQEVFPIAVTESVDDLTGINTLGLNYTDFIPVLIKAVQEQDVIIKDLQNQIQALT